jgi:hypothetical protein
MTIPNAVLFKHKDLIGIVSIDETGKGNWDSVGVIDKSSLIDNFDDVSVSNPFEFVFCYFHGDVLKSTNQKSSVPNQSFETLYQSGMLENTIEQDFYNQFLKDKNEN